MLPLLVAPAVAAASPWRVEPAPPLLAAGSYLQRIGTLDDGRVFVDAGSLPQVFDGTAWHWLGARVVTSAGPLARIPGGVLVMQGAFIGHPGRGAVVWTAKTDAWRETGGLAHKRTYENDALVATLADGSVLVAGGSQYGEPRVLADAERWTASADGFQPAGRMATPRLYGTLTALPDGRALAVGGTDTYGRGGALAQCELYDPKTNRWTPTGDLHRRRRDHTATLLPDGRVLVAGGQAVDLTAVGDVEIWDPKTGAWTIVATLREPRAEHGAVLLPGNRVLFVGGVTDEDPVRHDGGVMVLGAETWNVATGRWDPVFDPPRAYVRPNLALLADGRLVVAGGHEEFHASTAAEVWSPGDGPDAPWELVGSAPRARRKLPPDLYDAGATLTPLPDGVLAVGQVRGRALGARRWDAKTSAWSEVTLAAGRMAHIAVALPDGRVLLAGGVGLPPPPAHPMMRAPAGPTVRSAELFDPATGEATKTGAPGARREHAAATVLADGRVLVAGGAGTATAEVWSPKTGRFTPIASMHVARAEHTATTLRDGRVVVIGGDEAGTFEVYDPTRNHWSAPRALPEPWSRHSAELLPDGRVLVTAGGRRIALRVD
jgi:hypothetical protein